MSFVICVANEKGGVAKTTSVLSLGGALSEAGKSVLLIDLDAQANLTVALEAGLTTRGIPACRVLLDGASISQATAKTSIPGLDLLTSGEEMSLVERLLPARPDYETRLRRLLRGEPLDYDYIIIDCPPLLGAVTTNALAASDLLIMPTQAEYFSIHALKNVLNLIRLVRSASNPSLRYRILLTMFDKRNRIHRILQEQLSETFSEGVFQTVIEVDTRLRESPISGLPITMHAPASRSAVQYRTLAQEIEAYAQETV